MEENKSDWFKRHNTPSVNLYHVYRNREGGRLYYAPNGNMQYGRIMYRGEIESMVSVSSNKQAINKKP
jgi:hypothetical protein